MENADPSARVDLERFMEDLVPEDYPYFIHTHEGPDDMPSHVKMALTRTSEQIPFTKGRLQLGTWQGVFYGSTEPPHIVAVLFFHTWENEDLFFISSFLSTYSFASGRLCPRWHYHRGKR